KGGELPEGWHVYDAAGNEVKIADWKVPPINQPKPFGYGEAERSGDKEPESHRYRGYSDGSSCYVCGNPKDHPLHKVIKKDSAVTKSYGTGTPSGGTPNDPSIDAEDDEEEKTANIKGVLPRAAAQAKKRADIGIKETPKFLPPRDDIRRHLDEDVRDEVMEGVNDEQSLTARVASDPDGDETEFFLD